MLEDKEILDGNTMLQDRSLPYAGFWKRLAAYVLDATIVNFVAISFFWYFLRQVQSIGDMTSQPAQNLTSTWHSLFTVVLFWTYFAGMESSPLRATIGKLAVGLYVTDMQGRRISFSKATGRFFGKLLSGAILCIGFMMAGWTEKKQGLHDMMADTLVLQK